MNFNKNTVHEAKQHQALVTQASIFNSTATSIQSILGPSPATSATDQTRSRPNELCLLGSHLINYYQKNNSIINLDKIVGRSRPCRK